MELRHLFYLRAVLFLTLLLGVLFSPDLQLSMGLTMVLLFSYGCVHAGLSWLLWHEEIPADWTLHASIFDVILIAAVIYATSGFDINLYVAYFVVIIGALLMTKMVFGFLIAGVACLFYGVTVAIHPEAFSKIENLLPFALLMISSFFITFVSHLFRGKMKAIEDEKDQKALWSERMSACRRVLVEVKDNLQQPLDHILSVSKRMSDEDKASEIRWEVEGIWGHLKEMDTVLGLEKAKKEPLELQAALERAFMKLASDVDEKGVDVDVGELPAVLVRASKDHIAELYRNLIKDLMDELPKGGRINITSRVRPAQWWERGQNVKSWLRVDMTGELPEGAKRAGDKPSGPNGQGSQTDVVGWILSSLGGRLDETPEGSKLRYRFSLPVCGFSRKKKAAV